MRTPLQHHGRFRLLGLLLAMALLVPLQSVSSAQDADFDLETGNGLAEVVIPQVVPVIFSSVSAHASDAPQVLHLTTNILNAWFDALAPYHPTAVGVYSRIDRRPVAEAETNHNKNIAGLHASLHVLTSLLPAHTQRWHDMLATLGLDPEDASEDLTTAVGIGNHAGRAIVAVRERDGMNHLGDAGGRSYNRRPYADTTGYEPVNTPDQLIDPSRWQPAIVTAGNGVFEAQRFVTPQLAETLPYSYDDPGRFRAPPPRRSDPEHGNGRFYREQADEVLAASAGLTDRQKATAELFDNKVLSLGFSALHVAQQRGMPLFELVTYDFMVNVAAFDTAIAVWQEKRRYDAVRPFSAITWLYGDELVSGWGGPGRGTVDDLPGREWSSYLPVADHPEYPSGSASFCAAHAQASRRLLGSDDLGWTVPVAAGGSRIEPGITPAADLVLTFDTWTDFAEDCGNSRVWAGVHFNASVPAGQRIGTRIGDTAYEFVMAHVDGKA